MRSNDRSNRTIVVSKRGKGRETKLRRRQKERGWVGQRADPQVFIAD